MKKVLLVIAMLSVLLMIGCNRDIKNNESKNNLQEIEEFNTSAETDEVSTIEVKGVKYKDINSIPNIESNFDSSLVYADTIKDGEELYVKLSDNFVIDETIASKNNENSNKKVILP